MRAVMYFYTLAVCTMVFCLNQYQAFDQNKFEMADSSYIFNDFSGSAFQVIKAFKFYNDPTAIKEKLSDKNCFETCQKHEYCVSISFDASKKECFLYNSTKNGYTMIENDNFFSVIPIVKSKQFIDWISLSEIHIKDYYQLNKNITESTDCLKICNFESDCNSFTYDLIERACYLSYSSSLDNFYYRTKAVSGFRKKTFKDLFICDWIRYNYLQNVFIENDQSPIKTHSLIITEINKCLEFCTEDEECRFIRIKNTEENFKLECELFGHFTLVDRGVSQKMLDTFIFEKISPLKTSEIWNFTILNNQRFISFSSEFYETFKSKSYKECLAICLDNKYFCVKVSYSYEDLTCLIFGNFSSKIQSSKQWVSFEINIFKENKYPELKYIRSFNEMVVSSSNIKRDAASHPSRISLAERFHEKVRRNIKIDQFENIIKNQAPKSQAMHSKVVKIRTKVIQPRISPKKYLNNKYFRLDQQKFLKIGMMKTIETSFKKLFAKEMAKTSAKVAARAAFTPVPFIGPFISAIGLIWTAVSVKESIDELNERKRKCEEFVDNLSKNPIETMKSKSPTILKECGLDEFEY